MPLKTPRRHLGLGTTAGILGPVIASGSFHVRRVGFRAGTDEELTATRSENGRLRSSSWRSLVAAQRVIAGNFD